MSKYIFLFFSMFFVCTSLGVHAQDSVAAAQSEITAASLPKGAERLLAAKIPDGVTSALDQILQQGKGQLSGGAREVLAWAGNYKKQGSAASLINQLQINFRQAGWQYNLVGRDGNMEVFRLTKADTPRRTLLGFFAENEEVVVCALTEVQRTDTPAPSSETKPQATTKSGAGELSLAGKWFRSTGGSTIDYTGKTKLKSGVDFTFEFFPDGAVEYTRKEDVLSIMQCKIDGLQKARGRFTTQGNTLTINLGPMKSVYTNSCNAKENHDKMLESSTMTVRFEIKKLDDITRPDKPTILCLDGNDGCFERQR